MRLSSRHVVVWWAWLFEIPKPYQTDLCSLFWRTVLFTPLKLTVFMAIGFMLAVVIVDITVDIGWITLAVVFLSIIGAFVLAGGVVWLLTRQAIRQATKQAIFHNPIVKGASYIKEHYCPLIQIERTVPAGSRTSQQVGEGPVT